MKEKLKLLTFCLLAAAAQAAKAEDIKWNGYLNVVVGGLKNNPVSDFSDKQQHPGRVGYDKDFSFQPESSAALQATKKLDKKTSVTAQFYSEGETDDFAVKMKWAYLTYNLTNKSTVKVGKLGAPVYYFSDFFNVGYAYHWVTPPHELYTFDSSYIGVDYLFRDVIGNWDWSFESSTGGYNQRLEAIHADVKTSNTITAIFTASTGGWLNLRAMLYQSKGTFKVDGVDPVTLTDSAFAGASSKLGLPESVFEPYRDAVEAEVSKTLDLNQFLIRYAEVAARMEFDRWLFMGEWITIQTDNYVYNDNYSWFVTGGYRVGKAFYHVTYAEQKTKIDDPFYKDVSYVGTDAHYFATQIDTAVVEAASFNNHSVTLGVRVDTSPNTAVKFEVVGFEEKPSYITETAGIGKNVLVRAALNVIY